MMKKYLVTGPTGSTGSKTVKLLLATGTEVRAYVHRQDERSAALSALAAELVTGDLLDFEAVRRALEGAVGAYFVHEGGNPFICLHLDYRPQGPRNSSECGESGPN